MSVINGIDERTRERVLTGNAEQDRLFAKDVYATSAGKRFLADCENTLDNLNVVYEAAKTLYGDVPIRVSMYVAALTATMNAGDLKRKATPAVTPAPTPQAEVPRDKNGRPLTAAQIKFGEMTRFLAERSSAEIAERRRIDPDFREFIQHNIREQLDQPIDGDVRETNPHLIPKTPTKSALADKELVEFANRYRTMSTAEIRKSKRFDSNPLGAKKFNDSEARAIEFGLI